MYSSQLETTVFPLSDFVIRPEQVTKSIWPEKKSATEIADSILSNPWTSRFLETPADATSQASREQYSSAEYDLLLGCRSGDVAQV